MRMVYVGSLATNPDRDSGWIYAFQQLGCKVIPFCSEPNYDLSRFVSRLSRRLNIGWANEKLQQDLIALVDLERPEWVHFRLPVSFDRKTILELKRRNITVTQYFNDDPFSQKAPLGINWKFRKALTAYDGHFVYRHRNVEQYRKAGAIHVEHCPPTYDPRRHKFNRNVNGRFIADVAFIGHWENDWRVECLDALVWNGFNVILKGGGWDNAIRNRLISRLAPITHAFGQEYNHIYANVIAGLCFFSKVNNDSWTERALEIIAVGGVLVCERTAESQTYFKDRSEAYYFSSIDELLAIVRN